MRDRGLGERSSGPEVPQSLSLHRDDAGLTLLGMTCRVSGGEAGEFFADGVHEGAEGFFGEVEDDAGGGDEFRQRAGAAELEGGSIV